MTSQELNLYRERIMAGLKDDLRLHRKLRELKGQLSKTHYFYKTELAACLGAMSDCIQRAKNRIQTFRKIVRKYS